MILSSYTTLHYEGEINSIFARQRSLKAADTPAKEIHCTQANLRCLVTGLLTSMWLSRATSWQCEEYGHNNPICSSIQTAVLAGVYELVSGDLMHFNNKLYFI